MYNTQEFDQLKVYFVGGKEETVPFERHINLVDKNDGRISLKATFDDGAMVNVIDAATFNMVKDKLTRTLPSPRVLRMANGTLIPSEGSWLGDIVVEGVRIGGAFEIFPSGGAWQILLGKPILQSFRAVHEYVTDTIIIKSSILDTPTSTATIQNDNRTKGPAFEPIRELEVEPSLERESKVTDKDAPLEHKHITNDGSSGEQTGTHTKADIHIIQQIEERTNNVTLGTQQPEILVDVDTSIFTRATDAFKHERVQEIKRLVEIGQDLSSAERRAVEEVISDFADIYALSVSEVEHIPGASLKLNIPEGTQFSTRIHQQKLSPPKAAYFSKALDVMLEAGICEPIEAKDVKCVSPITLTEKPHNKGGMTMEEIVQCLNRQCDRIKLDIPFVEPEGTSLKSQPTMEKPELEPQKFRVCTNYRKLNEVTQVLPMPQGDIRTKQQAVSGHRWISLFDFAAGFYAVEVAPESRPYTAFYVEGRGYFVYRRMPFGLTGAPSCFNEVTAKALQGLVGTMIQLFVDDGAMACNTFADKLANLCIFFTHCREQHLSLSPQKTKLFMTKVVFAGERVGINGI